MFHNITILTVLLIKINAALVSIRGFFEKECDHFAGHLEQKLISLDSKQTHSFLLGFF